MKQNIQKKYDDALAGKQIQDLLTGGLKSLVMSRKALSLNRPVWEDGEEPKEDVKMTGYFNQFVAELPEPKPKEEKSKYLEVRGIKTKQLLNPYTIPNIVQIAIDYQIDIRFWHYGQKIMLERKYLTGKNSLKGQDFGFQLVKVFNKGEFGYYLKRIKGKIKIDDQETYINDVNKQLRKPTVPVFGHSASTGKLVNPNATMESVSS